jgi:DNA-binding transcriptional ArsR family regulator
MSKPSDPEVALLHALAESNRLAIVRQLAHDGEVSACDLTACCQVAQPTVSHHLKVLREAGVVDRQRRGTHRPATGCGPKHSRALPPWSAAAPLSLEHNRGRVSQRPSWSSRGPGQAPVWPKLEEQTRTRPSISLADHADLLDRPAYRVTPARPFEQPR